MRAARVAPLAPDETGHAIRRAPSSFPAEAPSSGCRRRAEYVANLPDLDLTWLQRAKSWLDHLAIADDDDGQPVWIDVLARDALHVGLRHGIVALHGRGEEIQWDAVGDEREELRRDASGRLEVSG